jgi:hypothetical protein
MWRATLGGVTLVITLAALCALVLALGAADPPVASRLVWRAANWPEALTLAPGAGQWLAAPAEARLPDASLTLHVSAQIAPESDPGMAWGVWLAASDGARPARALFVVSGEGYITTRVCPLDDLPDADIERCAAPRPEWRWSWYPRARGVGDSNRITLYQEPSGAIRFRLNDEKLGIMRVARAGAWGVWARGGRTSEGKIIWQEASVFEE